MKKPKSQQYPLVLKVLNSVRPGWVAEHRFHPVRRWRFDFANPELKLAVEIDGGIWTGGRHSGGKGQEGDMAKGNAACIEGWQVMHFTPQQARNGSFLMTIRNFLATRKV